METLYDVLEVSRKASPEIIEKAYKTLAKKYHPDLQTENNKTIAETKMKKINEAYSILGDEQKRKKYDEKLENEEKLRIEQKENLNNTKQEQKSSDWIYIYSSLNKNEQTRMKRKIENELNEEYKKRYETYFKNIKHRKRHKWTKKDFIALMIVILSATILFLILWWIPATHIEMVKLYNNNMLVKIIVNIIWGFFNSIGSFFKIILKV